MTTHRPVLLINFNRPSLSRSLINSLRPLRPSSVYFFVDGPRQNSDEHLVLEVQSLASEIDWECNLNTKFAPVNHGCKGGVITAIDWVFESHDTVIVLEDDCMPHPDFLGFCEAMLDFYADDPRIGMISGTNDLAKDTLSRFPGHHYLLDYFGSTWGWATWKRSWSQLDRNAEDIDVQQLPPKLDFLRTRFPSLMEQILEGYQEVQLNLVDTWDYQWAVTRLVNGELTVVPNGNLIVNTGFGPSATHTRSEPIEVPKVYHPVSLDTSSPKGVLDVDWFSERLEARSVKVRRRVARRGMLSNLPLYSQMVALIQLARSLRRRFTRSRL